MLNNKVNLTDDELSLIQTSLEMSINTFKKYKEKNGDAGLDFASLEAFEGFKELFARLNKEYFTD